MMIRMVGLALVMIGSLMLVNNTSAVTHSLTLTSSGSQSIDVVPSAGTAISSDSINVATTCRYGYNFTIQTSVEDNTLYYDGDSESSANTWFSPIDVGTLNETENMWGYFYDDDNSYIPAGDDVFWPVPSSLEEPAFIRYPLDSPASSNINDNFNIYYGVSVSPTAEKGTYKMIPDENDNDGTIVYIATVAEECSRYTVQFSPTSEFEGNTLSGTGTMDDQVFYEGETNALDDMDFTAPSGYYFAAWNTAPDGSGTIYTEKQEVTDITTAGSSITLYAMWTDCPPSTICYSPNVSNPNDVEGEMGDEGIIGLSWDTRQSRLYAPNFRRENYGFAGWNTNQSGTGTNYGPNYILDFPGYAYSTGGLKLYAKWVASAGNMQGWTCPNNTNMPIGTVTALKDTRDNNVYAVAKLADGKCWMTENLRLADKDSSNNDIILSSANTNNPSLPLKNTWWYSSANDNDPIPTSNHLSATTDAANWCHDYNFKCIDQSMLATDNTTLFVNNTASNYDPHGNVYSYGNYYNWYSATAGNGTIGFEGDASGDICPSGWHLPTGNGVSGEYGILDIALGGTGLDSDSNTDPTGSYMKQAYASYPNNFVYSGEVRYFTSGTIIDSRGHWGDYWTSFGGGSVDSYILAVGDAGVSPAATSGVRGFSRKFAGDSVRCIAGT